MQRSPSTPDIQKELLHGSNAGATRFTAESDDLLVALWDSIEAERTGPLLPSVTKQPEMGRVRALDRDWKAEGSGVQADR